MEILLALATSMVLELVKWSSKKLGKEVTKSVIYMSLFALSLMFVILTEQKFIAVEALNKFVELLLLSVGIYEGLIKRLGPVLFSQLEAAKGKIVGMIAKK